MLNAEDYKDIFVNTMDKNTKPEHRLRAIRVYAEGVMADFPETKTWMTNILILAGYQLDDSGHVIV